MVAGNESISLRMRFANVEGLIFFIFGGRGPGLQVKNCKANPKNALMNKDIYSKRYR